MNRLKEWCGVNFESADHHLRAKRKLYKNNNTHKEKVRHECYLEMIRVARKTLSYAENAEKELKEFKCEDINSMMTLMSLEGQLKCYIPLVKRVIEQAHRRIVKGENVPVSEKIVSIFEPETDVNVKGHRDIVFGHKVFLATGKSSLIFQVRTLDGNSADASLVEQAIQEHKQFYKYAPSDVAFDGGFASVANRDFAKNQGVQNITFSKSGNMPLDIAPFEKFATSIRSSSGHL